MSWMRLAGVSLILLSLSLPIVPSLTSAAAPLPPEAAFSGWWNATRGPAPPPSAGTMMAYDNHADRFLFFGGWDGTQALNQTWTFAASSGSWTQLHPASGPLARGDAALAYDPGSDLFYLFGGWHERTNGTYYRLNDTWSYSLSLDQWTELPHAGGPSPRSDVAMAYDSTDSVLLLFGGFSNDQYYGGTWAFGPVDGTWSAVAIIGGSPSNRSDGRLTYAPINDRLYLFGGNDFNGPNETFHHLNDTWVLDYPNRTWTELPTPRAPPARDYTIQAFAPGDDWVLVFGGYGNRTILNDLWAFSPMNGSWWPIEVPGAPPPRFAGTGGFDPESGQFVAVGGDGTRGLLNDSWTLNVSRPATGDVGSSSTLRSTAEAAAGVAVVGVTAVAAWWWGRGRRGRDREVHPPPPAAR